MNSVTDEGIVAPLTDTNKNPAKWFRHFDKIAKQRGWTGDVKAVKVTKFLRKEAQGIYNSMRSKDKENYQTIKRKLIKKLTPEDALDIALQEFNEATGRNGDGIC